ncbi:MAG: hypothetical protein E6J01_00705 [Chloroflexi bacterium]|nr:MAG: hypothetical protein E6J01_00705 [Chloroflexota bacterium]
MSRRPRSAWLLAVLVIPLAACSASSQPRPTPSPAAQATPTPAPSQFTSAFPRGAYGKDGTASGYDLIRSAGFNAVMTGAFRADLDALQAQGLKGVVWLGQGYNTQCVWQYDDAWIRAHVSAIAGHPAILAYYLGDEPSVTLCPNSPALYRARTALVRSIDPEHPTFTVLQVSDHGNRFAYAPWLGTVDIVGLDVYPCNHTESTCDLSKIDDAVAAARQQGLTRFWAVVQDFQDGFYRIPTPDELRLEFEHWDRSSMSGYFVFSWDYKGLSLDTLPDNVAQLKLENLAHGG